MPLACALLRLLDHLESLFLTVRNGQVLLTFTLAIIVDV